MENPNEDIELTCITCNETFTFTTGDQAYFASKFLHQPKRCPKCRQYRKEKSEYITCVECGEQFIFSVTNQAFFASELLSPPKRCPRCRAKRKADVEARKRGEMQ